MGNEAPTLIISANGRNSAWNQKFIHISFPGWIILHVLKVWCFSCDFFLRDKSWVLSALIYQMAYFFLYNYLYILFASIPVSFNNKKKFKRWYIFFVLPKDCILLYSKTLIICKDLHSFFLTMDFSELAKSFSVP